MRRSVLACVACGTALAGCGSENRAAEAPRGPTELTCADLRAPDRLQRVSRQLVVRVVTETKSRAETADLIAGSLRATCRQPGRADYRPVRPVLRAVQRHLDEDDLFEGDPSG